MAANIGIISWTALTTGVVVKTMGQISPATNFRVKVLEISVSFHGVAAANDPITVDFVRQTAAGTSTAATMRKIDSGITQALATTGGTNFTVEPTLGAIIKTWAVHPQRGLLWMARRDEGLVCNAGGTDRFGLRVLAGTSVTCDGFIKFME